LVIANPLAPAGLIQPVLTGLDEVRPALTTPEAAPVADETARVERAVAADRRERAGGKARRRYWSVRDLSRRIWLGRGYELLRELIRSGLLPATRSARSWWIDDEHAAALMAAFDDRAGKVRAFGGLGSWLRERAYVAPLTPEAETLARLTKSGFAWRGQLYLPKSQWTGYVLEEGAEYRHRNGAVVAA
jgi:hypothetical protein